MRLFLLALALAVLPVAASAQSWCGERGLSATEQTICRDAILGDLDAELNAVYDGLGRRGLDADQNRWLTDRRDACGRDILCIEQAYRDRIAALRNLPLRRVDPTKRPWCKSSRLNPTEREICSSDLLADLDAALGAVYGGLRARAGDDSQNDWLRGERDGCGANQDCIAAAYIRRIVVLGGRLRGD